MSDPRREQAIEKLIEEEFRRQAQSIIVDPAENGAVCIALPGHKASSIPGRVVATLSREQAIMFSQELIRAIAAGEPTWEGFD